MTFEVKKIMGFWISLGLVIVLFFIGAGLTLVKQDFSQAALNEDTKIVDVFFNGNLITFIVCNLN